MSSTPDTILSSEAFPTLGGGSSSLLKKKATAWSKPLSVKASVSEDKKVEEERREQESKVAEKAEGTTPAKNPQEDSDQEGAKSIDSQVEEQGMEQQGMEHFKPWRTIPAESNKDAVAAKDRAWWKAKASTAGTDEGEEESKPVRPWHKTAGGAGASSVRVEACDNEANEEVSRRPWKKSTAAPWRKFKVEEALPEGEEEEQEKLKNDEEDAKVEKAKDDEEQKTEEANTNQEDQVDIDKVKRDDEEQKKVEKAERAKKDADESLQTEKAGKTEKSEDERIQVEKAKKDDEWKKKAKSNNEEKESRRRAFAEKFKALKEAEEMRDQVDKKALTSSMTSEIPDVAQTACRDEASSDATHYNVSETEKPACRSTSAKQKPGSLSGAPVLAPGGKLTGSLTGSLTSLSMAPTQSQVEKSKAFCEAKESKSTKEKEAEDDEWRPLRRDQPVVLESSETSWAARQKQRREQKNAESKTRTDEEIVREMKSILNKLTIEKYDTLYRKMLSCGISTVEHVRILIHEVMEKATTQHHFIDMYSQFCSHLHEWFVENKISSDKERSFKRLLLDECQRAFEKYLGPIDLVGLQGEALVEAQLNYKLKMLGNIKFVGALLQKKMLASSVLINVAEELVSDPSTPEALESLATFLTSVGGAFDRDDWSHHKRFNVVFEKMQKKLKDKSVPARVRFLIQDVVDLRSTGWEDLKKATKKQEGPCKLADVEKKREAEEKGEDLDGFMTVSR